jgi:hypothetical protein
MSISINALLIFCEGSHDLAVLRTIFRQLLNYEVVKAKFFEMPYPMNLLFSQLVRNRPYDDLSLDMVHKFYLPSEILRRNNNIVLMFECAGRDRYDTVKTFLTDYLALSSEENVFSNNHTEVIKNNKYLFVFDADENGIEYYSKLVKKEYGNFNGINFFDFELMPFFSNFGKVAMDKALFVWGVSPEKGTIEDVLMPILEFKSKNKTIKEKAGKALDDLFGWNISGETKAKERAKYNKALLTISGQRDRPGKSLNVILKDRVLIDEEDLKKSPIIKEFVEFLKSFYGDV